MFFCFAIFVADAKATGQLERIKKADKIRIAVDSDDPPFSYKNENGEVQGYAVYPARRIAKDLLGDERKVSFVFVGMQNRINVLQSNQVDLVLASFTVPPECARHVDFAKPYMKVTLSAMPPNHSLITDVKQLKGKKLIVEKGTIADSYFKKNHPEVVLIKNIRRGDVFEAFRNGESDALSHDNGFILAWMLENPGFKMVLRFWGILTPLLRQLERVIPSC